MVRSRAMRARESGQVRKEAALSGSEQATRIGLSGASLQRKRPGTAFEGGPARSMPSNGRPARSEGLAKNPLRVAAEDRLGVRVVSLPQRGS